MKKIEAVTSRPTWVDYEELNQELPVYDTVVTAVTELANVWEFDFDHHGARTTAIGKEYGVEPHIGDQVRIYSNGFGCPHRGMVIRSEVAYYESRDAYRARMKWETNENHSPGRIWEDRPCPTTLGMCY